MNNQDFVKEADVVFTNFVERVFPRFVECNTESNILIVKSVFSRRLRDIALKRETQKTQIHYRRQLDVLPDRLVSGFEKHYDVNYAIAFCSLEKNINQNTESDHQSPL